MCWANSGFDFLSSVYRGKRRQIDTKSTHNQNQTHTHKLSPNPHPQVTITSDSPWPNWNTSLGKFSDVWQQKRDTILKVLLYKYCYETWASWQKTSLGSNVIFRNNQNPVYRMCVLINLCIWEKASRWYNRIESMLSNRLDYSRHTPSIIELIVLFQFTYLRNTIILPTLHSPC